MSPPNKQQNKQENSGESKRCGKRYCFACKCNSKKVKVSFFRFPAEEPRCTQWFYNIFKGVNKPRLPKYNADYAYLNLRICAYHFTDNMFSNKAKTRIHIDAIPTEFQNFEFVAVASEERVNGLIEEEILKTELKFKIKEEPIEVPETVDFKVDNLIIKKELPSSHAFNKLEENEGSGNCGESMGTKIKPEVVDGDSISQNALKNENIDIPFIKTEKIEMEDC